MAKNTKNKSKGQKKDAPRKNEPWLSQRTGLRVILVVSLSFAILVILQLYPSMGVFSAILWGLGFGLAVWGVFGLSLAFNRWLRRG